MRPEAHLASAADLLDTILAGVPAEKALTNWARKNRYAGSGDRAAIRDIVFDGLRRQRSLSWRGGDQTGRALVLGRLRADGIDPETVFTGERFALANLTDEEREAGQDIETAPDPVRVDCPDWLWPGVQSSLGDRAEPVLQALQSRAPVFLRANIAKVSRAKALEVLARDGVEAVPVELAPWAIEVTKNARRVRTSEAYLDGMVELQDAASQAVVSTLLKHVPQGSVLDYCAGGGGKSLALAAAGLDPIVAHDANAARMSDIPDRAIRSGVRIEIAATPPKGQFDCVLCDAPCSGSGAWRRQPEAKWTLTPDRLDELNELQDKILSQAQGLVAPGGILAYATCSLLSAENGDRVQRFLADGNGWDLVESRQWTPLDGADGFFLAVLRREAPSV